MSAFSHQVTDFVWARDRFIPAAEVAVRCRVEPQVVYRRFRRAHRLSLPVALAELSQHAFADDGRDRTHHNEYGAYALARMVVEGLRAADAQRAAGLATHVAADAGTFDPSHPPMPGTGK